MKFFKFAYLKLELLLSSHPYNCMQEVFQDKEIIGSDDEGLQGSVFVSNNIYYFILVSYVYSFPLNIHIAIILFLAYG